ncbi:MAG: hypothetical protein AAFQ36_04070 [Pseudomonadota bacterium]
MLRTVMIGSCMAVQGEFVRLVENGRMMVRVGSKTFVGRPV